MPESVAIIIVDHGSRLEPSNRMLEELASVFAQRFSDRYSVVEPAHMELAEPSIATAFGKCVSRGATRCRLPFLPRPGQTLDPGHPSPDGRSRRQVSWHEVSRDANVRD